MITDFVKFDFKGHDVRISDRDGNPWWIAKDVCDVLGLENNRQAVSYLDDDEKGVITADTLGGKQEMQIISESGLYSLILRSRKPEAKEFRRWITHEVLPSLRKTGAYAMDGQVKDDREVFLLAGHECRIPKSVTPDTISVSKAGTVTMRFGVPKAEPSLSSTESRSEPQRAKLHPVKSFDELFEGFPELQAIFRKDRERNMGTQK